MTTKQTGGPAFPLAVNKTDHRYTHGMSLRDWFAGQALAGLLANPEIDNIDENASLEDSLANAAYITADAMLKERDK